MSKQKRLFFGPIAGFVIVMLLAGMLYAPTALASAQIDDKGKNGTVWNSNQNTNNNSNHNTSTINTKDANGNQGIHNIGYNNIGNNNVGNGNHGNHNRGSNNVGNNNIGNGNQGNHNVGDNNVGNNNHGSNNNGNHNVGDKFTGNNNDDRGKDKNPKCNIHKYDGVCDFKKPELKITSPHNNGKVTGPSVTITGTASDSGVGLESVKVSIDLNVYTVVSTTNGPWSLTVSLPPGVHIVVAEASDKAFNISFDHAVFNVS